MPQYSPVAAYLIQGHTNYTDPQPALSLIPVLLDCHWSAQVQTVRELLVLVDTYQPAPDLEYVNAASDLEDHNIKDALDLKKVPVEILRMFRYLGPSWAWVINQYIMGECDRTPWPYRAQHT